MNTEQLEHIKNILDTTPHDTLCEWYCTLNKWEALPELGIVNEDHVGYATKTPLRSEVMREIAVRTDPKQRSFIWNISRMTREQHDLWWEKNGAGSLAIEDVVYAVTAEEKLARALRTMEKMKLEHRA